LLPAKAFEMSTTSHHQMNNNELNEFKPSLIIRAANRIIILLPLIQNLLEYNTHNLSKGKSDGLKLTEPPLTPKYIPFNQRSRHIGKIDVRIIYNK
ncbi:MAG TPA: hypothetical protein VIP70_03420, partial [Nitrososphaeraceae archaeon]